MMKALNEIISFLFIENGKPKFTLVERSLTYVLHNYRKRVTSRSNTNNARGGIPGGSTSSMMRIYSDDSPGLRV